MDGASLVSPPLSLDKNIDFEVLRNKNVLITGAASGFGEATALQFARYSGRIVLADRNAAAGNALEQKLKSGGAQVKFIEVDVSSRPSQLTLFKSALAWLEGDSLDHVVVCAGVTGYAFDVTPEDPKALDDQSLEHLEKFDRTMSINLLGVLYTCQLAVKYAMGLHTLGPDERANVSKSVTIICSLAGYMAIPSSVDYTASKFAVRGMWKNMRQNLPKVGVRCNMINPGFVKTPLIEAVVERYESQGVKFATVEDVVEAIARVTTDPHCTGRSIAVTPEGIEDLCDDHAGKDAGERMKDLKDRGSLMVQPDGKIVPFHQAG